MKPPLDRSGGGRKGVDLREQLMQGYSMLPNCGGPCRDRSFMRKMVLGCRFRHRAKWHLVLQRCYP
jgi:hypothetical protein